MATSVELYDALKDTVGPEAAKMLAEAIPSVQDVATKADIARLEAKMLELHTSMMRWMLSFFVPLWIGVYGTMGAIIVTAVLKR